MIFTHMIPLQVVEISHYFGGHFVLLNIYHLDATLLGLDLFQ